MVRPVLYFLLTVLTSAILLTLASCGGAESGGSIQLNLNLPTDWENRLDMGVLSSSVGTPYIGSIRVQVAGAGGNESVEVPYIDRRTLVSGLTPGGGYTITVQAVTEGTVIMEKILQGVTLPKEHSLALDVNLIESGGFSYAGSLLYTRLQHSAVLYSSGVLVLGGNLSTGVMESIGFSGEGFSMSAFADSLTYPRTGQKAFLSSQGEEVLVFLGSQGQEDSIYEVIDLVNSTSSTKLLGTIRTGYFPAHYGSSIYLVGGYDTNSAWQGNTIKISDETLFETVLSGMGSSFAQSNAQCTVSNTKLACLGGSVLGAYSSTLETYDLSNEIYLYQFPITNLKSNFATTSLPNEKILITGGLSGIFYLKDAEKIDLSTNQSDYFGTTLNRLRAGHTATLLDDGRVLIVGGGATQQVMESAEILDPVTGISVNIPWKMRVPRYDHTATKLPNGNVLIIGGNPGDKTFEVFNPN